MTSHILTMDTIEVASAGTTALYNISCSLPKYPNNNSDQQFWQWQQYSTQLGVVNLDSFY